MTWAGEGPPGRRLRSPSPAVAAVTSFTGTCTLHCAEVAGTSGRRCFPPTHHRVKAHSGSCSSSWGSTTATGGRSVGIRQAVRTPERLGGSAEDANPPRAITPLVIIVGRIRTTATSCEPGEPSSASRSAPWPSAPVSSSRSSRPSRADAATRRTRPGRRWTTHWRSVRRKRCRRAATRCSNSSGARG